MTETTVKLNPGDRAIIDAAPLPAAPPAPDVPPPPVPVPDPIPNLEPLAKGYFPDSKWFTEPIPAAPKVDSRSKAFAAGLAGIGSGAHVSNGNYGVPVALGSTETTSMPPQPPIGEKPYGPWANGPYMLLADDTKAAVGTDRHLVVVSPDGMFAEENFKAEVVNRQLVRSKAFTRVQFAGNATGATPKELAPSNASGLSLLAGLLRPEDVARGECLHALVFSVPGIADGAPIAPASKNVGYQAQSWSVQEGARLQLDPSIDLSKLRLTPLELVVARCLQKYGAYLRDNGGQLAIYGETTTRWPLALRPNAWGPSLKNIPWGQTRLITP